MRQGAVKRTLISSKTVRRNLRADGIKMDDDLTAQQRQTVKDLRASGFTAFWRGTRLYQKQRAQQSAHSTITDRQNTGAEVSPSSSPWTSSMEEFPGLPPAQRSTQEDRGDGGQTTGAGGTTHSPVSTPHSSPGSQGRADVHSGPGAREFRRGAGRHLSSSRGDTPQGSSNAYRGSRGDITNRAEDTEPQTRLRSVTKNQTGVNSNRGSVNREARHQRCIDDMMKDQPPTA